MNETLIDLYLHNTWANARIIDWCATQPDDRLDAVVPGTYGSARDTLLHMVRAEEYYVGRLRGGQRYDDILARDAAFPGFDDLRRRAERSGADLTELARTTTRGETYQMKGDDGLDYLCETPVVLLQAINHATEHRAHISTALTTLGADPIEMDGWGWAEATGALRKA